MCGTFGANSLQFSAHCPRLVRILLLTESFKKLFSISSKFSKSFIVHRTLGSVPSLGILYLHGAAASINDDSLALVASSYAHSFGCSLRNLNQFLHEHCCFPHLFCSRTGLLGIWVISPSCLCLSSSRGHVGFEGLSKQKREMVFDDHRVKMQT